MDTKLNDIENKSVKKIVKFKRIYIEITNVCNLNCSFCSNSNKVKREMTPEEFKEYEDFAKSLGFRHVESSPLVRSSYRAERHIH